MTFSPLSINASTAVGEEALRLAPPSKALIDSALAGPRPVSGVYYITYCLHLMTLILSNWIV